MFFLIRLRVWTETAFFLLVVTLCYVLSLNKEIPPCGKEGFHSRMHPFFSKDPFKNVLVHAKFLLSGQSLKQKFLVRNDSNNTNSFNCFPRLKPEGTALLNSVCRKIASAAIYMRSQSQREGGCTFWTRCLLLFWSSAASIPLRRMKEGKASSTI
jgi:hypothetical protein